MDIQRPWMIQIELVCGCNLQCDFCANVSLPDKGKTLHFMKPKTFMNIVEGLKIFGDKMRIAFAMRGEPTLHPKIYKYTKYLKKAIPGSQITVVTNGIKLNTTDIKRFFDAGGNIVSIDCYGNTYNKFKERFVSFPQCQWKLYDYREFNIWQYHNKDIKIVSLIPDIVDDHSNTRTFTNQCDCISDAAYDKYGIQRPISGGLEKKCTNPFRELSIRYNGDMMICCKDWVSNKMVIANANINNIGEEWFNNKKLNMARKLLLNKCRSFHPCDKCTYFGGFRQGFLPKIGTLNENLKKTLVKRLNLEYGARRTSKN